MLKRSNSKEKELTKNLIQVWAIINLSTHQAHSAILINKSCTANKAWLKKIMSSGIREGKLLKKNKMLRRLKTHKSLMQKLEDLKLKSSQKDLPKDHIKKYH